MEGYIQLQCYCYTEACSL